MKKETKIGLFSFAAATMAWTVIGTVMLILVSTAVCTASNGAPEIKDVNRLWPAFLLCSAIGALILNGAWAVNERIVNPVRNEKDDRLR